MTDQQMDILALSILVAGWRVSESGSREGEGEGVGRCASDTIVDNASQDLRAIVDHIRDKRHESVR